MAVVPASIAAFLDTQTPTEWIAAATRRLPEMLLEAGVAVRAAQSSGISKILEACATELASPGVCVLRQGRCGSLSHRGYEARQGELRDRGPSLDSLLRRTLLAQVRGGHFIPLDLREVNGCGPFAAVVAQH